MSRRTRRIALTAAALALLLAVPAFAAALTVVSTKLTAWQSATTVPTCPGTQTASANADSWIDQGSTASNFGTDTILRVRSGSTNRRTLVRFTLPPTPAGCTLTLARLRLYSASAVTGRTLQALRISAAWAEGTVTWANRPASTGTAATVPSGTGWREWTVTTQTAAMYSGANNGFLIRDATEGAAAGPEQTLHSREQATNPPELVLTFG